MKQFFESYGAVALGILALLVLIAMITPIGNIVKTSLQGTAHKFSSSINSQTDTMTSDMEKMLENSMYVSEYAKEVLSKQRLYDVGEQSLTADDIVMINGVECYVLEATATKAKLITKEIYDAYFDDGGHTAEEVENYVGTAEHGTDKTYCYKYSTLRTWMNNFYLNELGSNPRIIPSSVNYYMNDELSTNLSEYVKGTLENEYVYALDTYDAFTYADKFVNTSPIDYEYHYRFWTTAGYYNTDNDLPTVFFIHLGGAFSSSFVNGPIGARPVFWITLE